MGSIKRLGNSALGRARRGLDRVLPDRANPAADEAASQPDDSTAPQVEPATPPEGPAAATDESAASPAEPASPPGEPAGPTRRESARRAVDKAMGGDKRDRELTTALLAVMIALLLLIPLGSIALVVAGLGGFPEGWEGAEFIEVTTAADGRPGSLREAIEMAAAGDADTVVQLEEDTTYRLTTGCERPGQAARSDDDNSGVLDVGGGGGLYIKGNRSTIMQECAGQRVLHSTGDDRLHLSEVTLTGGHATSPMGDGSGGALLAEGGGTVTIEDSLLTSNRAQNSGGAVALTGPDSTLKLTQSVISGNSAGTSGGGLWVVGDLDATNATITDNLAGSNGGVVATDVDLTFSTIVDNSTTTSAEARQLGAATLTSFASYVAGGTGSTESCSVERTISEGYNVGDDSSCGFGSGLGDLSNGPRDAVGLLGTYGAEIPGRPPVKGSVLVDRVPSAACLERATVDGQGRSREGVVSCDVGAIETPGDLDVSLTAIAGPVARPVAGQASYTG